MNEKESLNIGGKKYISSKRASDLTGYTSDYVGQLSRMGKVESLIVGRTRFVEEESILDYKKSLESDFSEDAGEYANSLQFEKNIEESSASLEKTKNLDRKSKQNLNTSKKRGESAHTGKLLRKTLPYVFAGIALFLLMFSYGAADSTEHKRVLDQLTDDFSSTIAAFDVTDRLDAKNLQLEKIRASYDGQSGLSNALATIADAPENIGEKYLNIVYSAGDILGQASDSYVSAVYAFLSEYKETIAVTGNALGSLSESYVSGVDSLLGGSAFSRASMPGDSQEDGGEFSQISSGANTAGVFTSITEPIREVFFGIVQGAKDFFAGLFADDPSTTIVTKDSVDTDTSTSDADIEPSEEKPQEDTVAGSGQSTPSPISVSTSNPELERIIEYSLIEVSVPRDFDIDDLEDRLASRLGEGLVDRDFLTRQFDAFTDSGNSRSKRSKNEFSDIEVTGGEISGVSLSASTGDFSGLLSGATSTFSGSVTALSFIGDGSALTGVSASAGTSTRLADLDSDTLVQVEESADEDIIRFDTAGTERMVILANGRVGIGTSSPLVSFAVDTTDAIKLPTGTSGQRPAGASGLIRFNTDTVQFEGFNGSVWSGLGGVTDVDQDTFILAESSPGADEDALTFTTAGTQRAILDASGNFGIGTTTPASKLDVWGDLRVGTSSTSNLFVDVSAGRVGIGTVSPSSFLDVEGEGSFTSLLVDDKWSFQTETEAGIERLTLKARGVDSAAELFLHPTGNATASRITISDDQNTNNYEAITLESNGINNYIKSIAEGTGTVLPLIFEIGGSDVMTIATNGNVGIGTTSPFGKLSIVGSSDIPQFIVQGNSTQNNDVFQVLKSDGNKLATVGNDGVLTLWRQPNAFDRALRLSNNFIRNSTELNIDAAFIVFQTESVERARLTSDGNLGIGTTSPSSKLTVAGDGLFTGGLTVSGTGTTAFSGSISLPATTAAGAGTINQDGGLLVHSFGTNNFFAGPNAGNLTLTGVNNVGIGNNALALLTSGNSNTALGLNALDSNTSGALNVAIGAGALATNDSGFSNTAVGYQALEDSINNSSNSAFGYQALNKNAANNNSAFGYQALELNISGSNNAAFGYKALKRSTGSNNSSFGYASGIGLAGGSSNTFLGYFAGDNVTTGSDNIIIGANTDAPSATGDNQLNIGDTIYGDLSTGNVGIGITSPDTKLQVADGVLSVKQTGTSATDVVTQFMSGFSGLANTSDILAQVIGAPNNAGGRLVFKTSDNTGVLTEVLRLDSTRHAEVSGRLSVDRSGLSNTVPTLALEDSSVNSEWIFQVAPVAGNFIAGANVGDLVLRSQNSKDLRITTDAGASTALSVLSGGNVGIGTTSPFAKLSVVGDGYFTGSLTAAGGLSSDASVSAPFFTATDSSATSTFSGDIVANKNILLKDKFYFGDVTQHVPRFEYSGTLEDTLTLTGNLDFDIFQINPTQSVSILNNNPQGRLSVSGWTEIVGIDNEAIANALTITDENGSEYFHIKSTASGNSDLGKAYFAGNVGIGTTSPFAKLSVVGSSDIPQFILQANGTQTSNITNILDSAGAHLASFDSNGFLRVGGDQSAEAFTQIESGVIRIGSDGIVPTETITHGGGSSDFIFSDDLVAPSLQPSSGATVSARYQFNGTANAQVSLKGNSNGVFEIFDRDSSTAKLTFEGSTGNLGIGTTSPFAKLAVTNIESGNSFLVHDQADDTTPFVIDASGNVGIGTDSPAGKLHVNQTTVGSSNAYVHSFAEVTRAALYTASGADTILEFFGKPWQIGSPNSGVLSGTVIAGRDLNFKTVAQNTYSFNFLDGADNELVTIEVETGNVGIGTTSPASQLHLLADEGDIKLGTGVFSSKQGTTDTGIEFSGNGGFRSGLFTEADGDLLSYGINVPQIGGRNNANLGGIFRFDTRGGNNPLFAVVRYPTGGTTANFDFSIDGDGRAGFADQTPDFGVEIAASSTNGYFGISSASGNDGDLFVVDGSGNVGIGTTSPDTKLQIQGGDLIVGQNPSSSGNTGVKLTESGTIVLRNGGNPKTIQLQSSGNYLDLGSNIIVSSGIFSAANSTGRWLFDGGDLVAANANGGKFLVRDREFVNDHFYVKAGLDASNAGSELWFSGDGTRDDFFIDSSGNVGIGAPSLGSKLQVEGDTNAYSAADLSTNAALTLRNNQNTEGEAVGIFFNLHDTNPELKGAGISGIRQSTTGSDLSFITSAGTSPSEKLRITGSGNVGIGTTSPDQALDVIGTVQASNLLGGAVNLTTDANGNIIRDPSDANLKDDLGTIEGALEKVRRLRGTTFRWKDTERFGEQTEIGFLAQEVADVVPEVVRNGGEYLSLNYKNLTALNVEAIKELDLKISDLDNFEINDDPDGFFAKLLDKLSEYGVSISKSLTRIKNLAVGSSASPAGITLYDQVTGKAYCVIIKNGAMVHVAGTCEDAEDAPYNGNIILNLGDGEESESGGEEGDELSDESANLPAQTGESSSTTTSEEMIDLSAPTDDEGQIGTTTTETDTAASDSENTTETPTEEEVTETTTESTETETTSTEEETDTMFESTSTEEAETPSTNTP